MRQILSSVKCDYCTKSEDFDTDEEQLVQGWVIVQYRGRELDFCDLVCLDAYDFYGDG